MRFYFMAMAHPPPLHVKLFFFVILFTGLVSLYAAETTTATHMAQLPK